ncbi:unnamed protein product [Auanema sp. JU1783]|nr:unnamed protein product [Auanema sp. JU1783]
MDGMNACTECGFTTNKTDVFQQHIENHEEEHRGITHNLSYQPTEWTNESSVSSDTASSLSPTGSVSENMKSPSHSPKQKDKSKSDVVPFQKVNHISNLNETPSKSSKRAYMCPHCNFTTFMSQHMKSHLEAHERHQGQMYMCDICMMQFSQKANMHRHRMRHSGVKPYECRFCKKRFFRKDQMQEHSMTHIKTGVDFDCPVALCNQLFSQHSLLRAHLEESHNVSPATPASCKRCSLLFANSRRLLLHYQTRHDSDSPENRLPETKSNRTRGSKREKKEDINHNNTSKKSLMTTEKVEKEKEKSSKTQMDTTSFLPVEAQMTSDQLLVLCLANSADRIRSSLLQNTGQHGLTSDLSLDPLKAIMNGSLSMLNDEEVHSPSCDSGSSNNFSSEDGFKVSAIADCQHCGIIFNDNTMKILHDGLHSPEDPFKCNLCGTQCEDKYSFTAHIIFANHSHHF